MAKHNSQELFSVLWSAADQMRSTMSADVYKDYLLGLVFYKSLSDKTLYAVANNLSTEVKSLDEAQALFESCNTPDNEDWPDLIEAISDDFGCFIEPKYTFNAFYKQINDGTFLLDNLNEAFKAIEHSQGTTYKDLFEGFDINSKDLGKTAQDRNNMLSSVIKALAKIDFTEYDDDALGDAYEYLISQFASESGKKAGEFYTPQPIARLISKIVASEREKKRGFSIYDPCCGSGSLLLQIKNYIHKGTSRDEDYSSHVIFYGQELNYQTYNLCRMNMLLHKVSASNQTINNGDSLKDDWPENTEGKDRKLITNFDAVVMNPPYSHKWEPKDTDILDSRFSRYEKLAPKSAADYAFLLHGFYHLKTDGVMGIVLPHGVLFRGGAEGVIRKHLVEDGNIYAVIGLPPNIFFNTSIPTTVIILKKDNTNKDILFIDASKGFKKGKKRNELLEEHIQKIYDAYINRENIEKYAHLASYEEIEANDFNLNIPRYVDTFEEEEEINLDDCFKEIAEIEQEELKLNSELNAYFKELGLNFTLRQGE